MSYGGVPPRSEHPDPIFQRPDSSWLNLNGKMWEFAVVPAKEDPPERWAGHINVPFCLQAPLAEAKLRGTGVSLPPLAPGLRKRDVLWYRRRLTRMPAAWKGNPRQQRVLLHVGACDAMAQVFVNGVVFEEHRGGSTPFTHDITDALRRHNHVGTSVARADANAENGEEGGGGGSGHDVVLLRCTDHACEHIEPRGKQLAQPYKGDGPHVGTLYSNITGIWQTVWLEVVPARAHLTRVLSVPTRSCGYGGEADTWSLAFWPELPVGISREGLEFEVALYPSYQPKQQPPLGGRALATARRNLYQTARVSVTLPIPEELARLWCPEDPHLYGVRLRLYSDGQMIDEVFSYVGLRTVSCRGEQVLLNGNPTFLRLVLDQGYYPDGLWTAPTDQALQRDILLAMGMGFNGARLHQKVFEPRYYYHADRLGFLTFAEYPDWAGGKTQRWTLPEDYKAVCREEWEVIVPRLHNHPSIIAWGPFNEFGPKDGWRFHAGAGGAFWNRYDPPVRAKMIRSHCNFVRDVVQSVRRQDKHHRPVHDSSGWIHVETDLWSFHTYLQNPVSMKNLLANPPPKYIKGRQRQPLLVAEYAGVGLDDGGPYGRNPRHFLAGYAGRPGLPADRAEALTRIKDLTACIYETETRVAGFCCTQLYDVEHEKNGLLRYDRRRKYSHAALRTIFAPRALLAADATGSPGGARSDAEGARLRNGVTAALPPRKVQKSGTRKLVLRSGVSLRRRLSKRLFQRAPLVVKRKKHRWAQVAAIKKRRF